MLHNTESTCRVAARVVEQTILVDQVVEDVEEVVRVGNQGCQVVTSVVVDRVPFIDGFVPFNVGGEGHRDKECEEEDTLHLEQLDRSVG